MKLVSIIFIFSTFIFLGKAQNCKTIHTDVTDDIIQFSYPPPANEPCTIYSWAVSVDNTYNIDITINYLDLDAIIGDYLTIIPGDSQENHKPNIIFTGKFKSKKFRVMNNGKMLLTLTMQARTTANDNSRQGFKLSYSAYGQTTALPPSTSPQTTLPTGSPLTDYDAVIYAANISPKNLIEKMEDFKKTLANMANAYCGENDIYLLVQTPPENVVIELITVCPMSWPNWDKCTKIQLYIPVYPVNNSTYELTGKHIRVMWNTKANEYMKDLGLQAYQEPNSDAAMLMWVYIAIGIVLIFAVVLIVAWKLNVFTTRNHHVSPSSHARRSNASSRSWISDTTYEVPSMFEENADISTSNSHPITQTQPEEGPTWTPDPYSANQYFQTRGGHINIAFDSTSEPMPEGDDDISSDEESSQSISHSTRSNQDHLYEAPGESPYGDYSEL